MLYKDRKKQIEQNKKIWLMHNKKLSDVPGIYILLRTDAENFKYAYVGQSLHCLTRLAEHLIGYQHIDLSLKKHWIYDAEENPDGWRAKMLKYKPEELDEAERFYIRVYAESGYQLRNKTIGGQNAGKFGIDTNKAARGYYDGKEQGWNDCQKYVREMFSKYLRFEINGEPNKIKERKIAEFNNFIKRENEEK